MASVGMAAAVDFGVQALVGGISIAMASEHYYDITGSLTFVLIALLTFLYGGHPPPPMAASGAAREG